MRRVLLIALLLSGCNFFDFTDVVNDVVQGPQDKLIVANGTDLSLQVLLDQGGVIEKEFPLGAVPVRLATHPDHSVVAVSYGTLGSRIDLIDIEAGTGTSVSLGEELAIDIAWADANRLFVLNDRGFQDIMVIGREEQALIGGWPLDDLDFHSRIAVHDDALYVNYRRYNLVLEGDGQLHSKWELATGDFTKIVHKQRLAPDGLGMLYASDGTAGVAEYSAETGEVAVRYDVAANFPDQRIVDFTYDPSGKWVFVMLRTGISHEVGVFDRASGDYRALRYAAGSDIATSNDYNIEFLVPGDEPGEVFVYGHRGDLGAITKIMMK